MALVLQWVKLSTLIRNLSIAVIQMCLIMGSDVLWILKALLQPMVSSGIAIFKQNTM